MVALSGSDLFLQPPELTKDRARTPEGPFTVHALSSLPPDFRIAHSKTIKNNKKKKSCRPTAWKQQSTKQSSSADAVGNADVVRLFLSTAVYKNKNEPSVSAFKPTWTKVFKVLQEM